MGMQQGCPVAVKEREGGADPVLLREAEVLYDRFRIGAQVPVGQHDPFLCPGAPGGEDDNGNIIVIDRRTFVFFCRGGAGR